LQTEEALRLRDRAVEASMNPVLIVSATDPAMPIVYVNRAFERVTGYGRSEVIGRNCRLLQRHDVQATRSRPGPACRFRAMRRRGLAAQLSQGRKLILEPASRDAGPRSVLGPGHALRRVQHDITGLVQYQDELERRAQYDALTALPNRIC
jgi:PAS domain S-box-containing protein